jgi:hypothetical protein
MTENKSATNETLPSARSWILVAITWLAVGAPLTWGIWKTLEKAAVLFR